MTRAGHLGHDLGSLLAIRNLSMNYSLFPFQQRFYHGDDVFIKIEILFSSRIGQGIRFKSNQIFMHPLLHFLSFVQTTQRKIARTTNTAKGLQSVASKDVLDIGGDFNPKVGRPLDREKQDVWRCSTVNRYFNEERLASFTVPNDLTISNTTR